jgi:hypothetical protein
MPTRRQLALIAVARKAVQLDEDAYRTLLMRAGGVESARELDAPGFDLLMREFRRLGFVSDFCKANLGARPGMATPGQVALIRGLWCEFTEGQGDDGTLGKWIESKFKISALRFLPRDRANKVIHALRAMVAKRKAT